MKNRVFTRAIAVTAAAALCVTGCGISWSASDEDIIESEEEASDEASQDVSEEEDKKSKEDSKKDKDNESDAASSASTEKEPVKLGNNADEERLLTKLVEEEDADPEDVREYVVGDLDGDGSVEGFVYVGDEFDEYNECFGSIYFVSDKKCEMICDDHIFRVSEDSKVFGQLDLGKRTLFTFNESYTTETMTHAYIVKDSSPVEASVSKIGYIFQREGSEDICISVGMYDHEEDYEPGKEEEALWLGHTWKNYYFYYDENLDDFREYGGYEISEEELNQIVGFDLAGEIRAKGYTLDAIYERGNGIVNVNYSILEGPDADGVVMATYENVSYDQKQQRFLDADYYGSDDSEPWVKSSFGGVYVPAIRENIATYDRYSR